MGALGGMEKGSMVALKRVNGGIEKGEWGHRVNGVIEKDQWRYGQGQWGY